MSGSVGLIGLGTMGLNLALNLRDRGVDVTGFDSDPVRRAAFGQAGAGRLAESLGALVAHLARPRTLLLMVPAGRPVDVVADGLRPLLDPGDVVIDGGNSHYADTGRRAGRWGEAGLHWVGLGISGGERGARRGPAMMAGGAAAALDRVETLLAPAAAATARGRCFGRFGAGGAGHFVKMVHNGIEYAEMQLIAEVTDLLRARLGRSAAEAGAVIGRWAAGEQGSYLLEITSSILAETDPEGGVPLLDLVSDRAEQKGTGHWALVAAAEMGVAVPTIAEAVIARTLSAATEPRRLAARALAGPEAGASGLVDADLEAALMAGRLCAFAQGFALLAATAPVFGAALDPGEALRVWSGGCIIRTRLLDLLETALAEGGPILSAAPVAARLNGADGAWRRVVADACLTGRPVPALASALAYRDGLAAGRLPTALIQAQRDCFGAHGYERTDRPGRFHSPWGAAS